MRKKLNEIGIFGTSLDLLETVLVKRENTEKKKRLFYNKRLQTSQFLPENHFKPVEPSLE
jgi:hypothetical protein